MDIALIKQSVAWPRGGGRYNTPEAEAYIKLWQSLDRDTVAILKLDGSYEFLKSRYDDCVSYMHQIGR